MLDPQNAGFITRGDEAQRVGTRIDLAERSNSNKGDDFGAALPQGEKDALIE